MSLTRPSRSTSQLETSSPKKSTLKVASRYIIYTHIYIYIYIYIYRVTRNFCKNHWNDYSSINTQYSLILRLFSKNLASNPIEKCLFFVLLSKISLFFFYFLQVLKPRPRGHPFPRSASTTYSLKKNGFFSCLLKLHNLKVSELQKELYPPKLRELEQF